jgi:hypothetical protein
MTAGFEFLPYAIRLQKPLTPVAGAFSFSSPAREDFALREGASPPHSG